MHGPDLVSLSLLLESIKKCVNLQTTDSSEIFMGGSVCCVLICIQFCNLHVACPEYPMGELYIQSNIYKCNEPGGEGVPSLLPFSSDSVPIDTSI